ncbi:hypothetical protein [Azospirillum sp.]|uniref:hypothetical protein n=1 Tax=Azospirillum sp. TaxID=34012 RepID=UPI003D705894
MSDAKNVKMGVCKITYGGVDLGYTKGGVDVEVATETHKVTVDQFGSTEVNEYIMGRNVKVKVPLAETTLENLIKVVPGASMVGATGAKATGSITFTSQPSPGDTIVVNGVTFTFRTAMLGGEDIIIGANVAETALNTTAVLNGSANASLSVATYEAGDGGVSISHRVIGTGGNTFTLSKTGANITVSGSALSGGTIGDAARVEVETGVGRSLLDSVQRLVLHPVALPEGDQSEDFVIPRAATTGALQFAYKVDAERVYNVEFHGYPDPATKLLFVVGDAA